MKKNLLLILLLTVSRFSIAQTFTYANFSLSLNDTLPVRVADNSSFNTALTSTTGNGVTWDASGLTAMSGFPLVNLSFQSPSLTPHATLYPSANYAEYDPALTAAVGYTFYGINQDSVVEWGAYQPSTQHEIFQNPDKHLIFPFSFGQSFTDDYSKTNYSDATTISSYQNGTRTVSFAGYGSLTLPQGTFTNVALITETRTNNLGPVSYVYTWYDLSNGRKLLWRSENGSSITTAWCTDAVITSIFETPSETELLIYPNPAGDHFMLETGNENAQVNIYNLTGELVRTMNINSKKTMVNTADFIPGIYFLQLTNDLKQITTGRIIVE